MNVPKVVVGLVFFFGSSAIVAILGIFDVSLMIKGVDYAPDFIAKILDCLAGSLIIWGLLDVSPRGKPKKGAKLSRLKP